MKRIAIFASGSGSNAENIYKYFEGNDQVAISLIVTNNPKAVVLERAARLKIPFLCTTRKQFYQTNEVVDILMSQAIDLIVLAGFLWLIPENLITAFPKRIINVHPALLPKYGGKGMYGHHVHEAVKSNQEKETGITIHYVNEHYDEGSIIFQAKCSLESKDTVMDIAEKIHVLEFEHFPKVIEGILF